MTGMDVQRLCDALSVPLAVAEAQSILFDEDYVFASERHADLVEALKLPEWSVGSGFEYLERETPPPGLQKSDLVRVGE